MRDENTEGNSIAINEAQLVLAEKRTSLAVMRTGIAILVVPLSIMSLLIATSKFYDVLHVMHLLIPLTVINSILVIFGFYLIIRSIIRMRRYDRLIHKIKLRHSILGEFLD